MVVHDAARLMDHSHANAHHMLKSFFVDSPVFDSAQESMLSLVRQLDVALCALTTKLLYNNLINVNIDWLFALVIGCVDRL